MTQRLKRWESPRRQGRNHKGRGGAARQRQLKKQQQMLRKKLKGQPESKKQNRQDKGGRDVTSSSFFLLRQQKWTKLQPDCVGFRCCSTPTYRNIQFRRNSEF
ncbi:hypothetical protein IQ249_16050 [Lusitaniella coriacea LEGE 07157]|uniref:Uncharacterized protein n=1 Tax=Lusitaniella coriacea LEGE 07157 TaxID=945747 RepID=A0A8J7DY69_9CYAN|nr:hypothetical protein [Lusitaniella coriacea]MBE9117413.1 hypothetical protein [Lusitaniella coriacea LEGE 07157]